MANASNRITHVLLVLVLFALLAVIGMLATTARGGPLDPPAGAPASTDGVRRPGTPISSLPFVTTGPGYYYLTRNLTGAAGTTGISVNHDNVTIDLGGFTLAGANTTGAGIEATATRSAIRVTNGTLRAWGTALALGPAVYSRVDNVTVIGAGNVGISLGLVSVIEDCNVSSNVNEGIQLRTSTLRNCTIIDNGTAGVTVFNNALIHDNHILNNNLTSQSGYADMRIEGDGSLVERNWVGTSNILGDENLFESNMASTYLFQASSESNEVVRGRWCSIASSGVDNYWAQRSLLDYEDTGSGHLAIPPERSMC